MKIAFVSFYSGYASRGGETYVDSLAQELSAKNEVVVFQAGPKTKKSYTIIETKTKYNPEHPHSQLPATHILKRLFLDYFHLKELLFTLKSLPQLRRYKPDIILPQNSGWEVIILKLFAVCHSAKIIVAGQSGPGWNDRLNLYVHPDAFVALTQSQADWAQKATPWNDQKIVVIPNGVDLEEFSPKGVKRALNVPQPIVLAVGAAIKSKRISDTIRAVALLPNVSLIVAGTGPLEKEEDTLGKALLEKRYKRLKMTHSDMPGIYRSANIFTLCSDSSEAFGIVYLEALASGLPCVVTDDSSRHEILGKAGIYVQNPEDSQEYATKLGKALKIKEKDTQITQASQFAWSKIASQYQKLLNSQNRIPK